MELSWIPVEEKLPEDGQEIIAWQDHEPHCIRTVYLEHIYHGFKTVLYGSIVTHWMPLPEPPKATMEKP